MKLKNHATEAERLIGMGDEEAEKWMTVFGGSLDKLPGNTGALMKDIVAGAFKAGYLKGVERTSELVAKRMDQLPEPGRKDYGDGEGGPVS